MKVFFWSIFPLIIWMVGYWITRGSTSENFLKQETFIKSPNWFYLLCGKPKGKDLPSGIMSLDGAFYQISAILMVLYVLILEFIAPSTQFSLERFAIGMLGSYGFALIISLILKNKCRFAKIQ